jgi:phage gp36-like protein
MYLTADEIYTHLYEETIEAISGEDERLLLAAIKGAISEAKGYLHAYDISAIFAKTGVDRDDLLLIWLKDIAVWHYINIARPAVDFDVRERRYNAAIAWLKGVQKGDIVPDFPRPVDPETNAETNSTGIQFGSNPKRGNYI